MQDIEITDDWLEQIKTVIATPILEDGDLLLTDENIKEYSVFPALFEYFNKFPLKVRQYEKVYNQLSVDFPNENTFGVAHIRATNKGNDKSNNANFFDLYRYNKSRYAIGRSYSERYNFNGLKNIPYFDQIDMATQQNRATFHYEVDNENRVVHVYTSIPSELVLTWASTSTNFNHVEHEYKLDVVKLSQAYLCRHIATIVGLINNPKLDIEISPDNFRDLSKDLFTEIHDKWNDIPDIILIRH